MKLGLDSYSTRNSGRDPVGVLDLADELGLQVVLFELSPFTSFADEELQRIRSHADEKGIAIELGMGSIFQWHPMAEKGKQLLADAGCGTDLSEAEIVVQHLKIAEKLGSPLLRVVAGNLFTRDEGHDMVALADQAVVILQDACDVAQEMGMRIAAENHADFTVREWASILARVNRPALGYTVDCANLAFDLDDPNRLAHIMAPYAMTTHFKNYTVVRTKNGLALGNCSLGAGDIDLVSVAEILAAHNPDLNINIEIHSQFAPFTLDILDDTFFDRHPSPPGEGLAWYLKRAWNKDIPRTPPVNLADGEPSWKLEYQHLVDSVRWAKENLSHLLSK